MITFTSIQSWEGSSLPADYLPIFVLFVFSLVFALGGITVSTLAGPRKPTERKLSPYESGMVPIGPARRRISVTFYLIAMLFILFDVEVVFLFPWAVVFRELKATGLAGAGIFIAVLVVGLIYVWKKGALEWE
jgi:NADH-quinone oxidoreductase subunit A